MLLRLLSWQQGGRWLNIALQFNILSNQVTKFWSVELEDNNSCMAFVPENPSSTVAFSSPTAPAWALPVYLKGYKVNFLAALL